jgi:glycosyltransferase involved in cell wall biosynthesis
MSCVEGRLPLVKVIVPCYGYAHLLEGCVRSVLDDQGPVDVRVLIVDDVSPDDTPTVGGRLAGEDMRVTYRRNERNLGLIGTANTGLEWAQDSDYVILISADDRLTPGSIGRAVAVMEEHPEVGFVYGHAQYFEDDAALPEPRTRERGTRVQSGREWIRLRCRSGHSCISSPEVVVRTSVQLRVGRYDPECTHASDLNMWLRLAAVSEVGYVKGPTQAYYRVHADSMLRSMLGSDFGQVVDLTERRTAYENFFERVGGRVRGADKLRETARRTLARQALWKASRAFDKGKAAGEGAREVERLVGFALDTSPQVRRLPEWWGMRLRRKIGSGRSLAFLPFLVTGAAHRLRMSYGHWRLHARGL